MSLSDGGMHHHPAQESLLLPPPPPSAERLLMRQPQAPDDADQVIHKVCVEAVQREGGGMKKLVHRTKKGKKELMGWGGRERGGLMLYFSRMHCGM